MHIALYKPDIPQNTAAIIRLGACLNLKIHIIEPCGFNLNDSRFKRVAMDYFGLSKILRYEDYDKFLTKNKKKRIILMTTKAKKNYHKFIFKKNDILLDIILINESINYVISIYVQRIKCCFNNAI